MAGLGMALPGLVMAWPGLGMVWPVWVWCGLAGYTSRAMKNLKIWREAPNFEIFPYRLGLTQPFDICQALAVNPLLFSCPTPCFLVKPLSIDQPLVISLVKPFLP